MLIVIYALLVAALMLWIAYLGLQFKNTLTVEELPSDLPTVSTVVPARNEERNIGRCAEGLLDQDYAHLEMIFVDDDSEDATPAILADIAACDARVKIVNTGGKPLDWNGKQWACHSGAVETTGDWLCFMDADTRAEPELINRTLAFAIANKIDMLTLQPWYEMWGLWERIILPVGLTPLLLAFPPNSVNDPDHPLTIANGQFILIRREVYEAVDGHAGVRDKMMDDFSLAESIQAAGFRLYIAEGSEYMRVRLYSNLREIWAGALKAAIQISGGWAKTVIGLIALIAVNVLPFVFLATGVMSGEPYTVTVMSALIVFQLIFYGIIRVVGYRIPPWSSVTYPLAGVLLAGLVIDCMYRVAMGRDIKWKGRDVMGRPRLPNQRT